MVYTLCILDDLIQLSRYLHPYKVGERMERDQMKTYYRFTWWVPKWGGPQMEEDRLKSSITPEKFKEELIDRYQHITQFKCREILK